MCNRLGAMLRFALGSLVLAGSPGCGPDRVEPPNVILIVVDTLRADAVNPDGDDPVMPFPSDLAARSVYYERAYAPSSWTLRSMTSLFLATYPSQHLAGSAGWNDIQPSGVTLAEQHEQLRALGYAK